MRFLKFFINKEAFYNIFFCTFAVDSCQNVIAKITVFTKNLILTTSENMGAYNDK